jgi:predicted alpha/beta-fold hydrolase
MGAGVIMAIVFSSKITGDIQDMYSPNNYYTGTSSLLTFLHIEDPMVVLHEADTLRA